jgi:hypothetical protein
MLGGKGTYYNNSVTGQNAVNDTGSGGGGGGLTFGGNGSAGICIILLKKSFPIIISNNVNSYPNSISQRKFYYNFTSTSGTNTITFQYDITCEILIVGGGGGSSWDSWGAGAGGNVYYKSSQTFNAGTYTIIVGSGGNNISYNNSPTNGNTSSIKYNNTILFSANGGGCGSENVGGSTSANINGVITNYSGSLTLWEFPSYHYMGYNSGGAGAGAGQNATTPTYDGYNTGNTGKGGDGYYSSITGTPVYYAGGAGGASYYDGYANSFVAGFFYSHPAIHGLGRDNYGGGGGIGVNPCDGCVILAFDLASILI